MRGCAGSGNVGQWEEGGAVGQREGGSGEEWGSERRKVQWEKGGAVGHVVILLHPPN